MRATGPSWVTQPTDVFAHPVASASGARHAESQVGQKKSVSFPLLFGSLYKLQLIQHLARMPSSVFRQLLSDLGASFISHLHFQPWQHLHYNIYNFTIHAFCNSLLRSFWVPWLVRLNDFWLYSTWTCEKDVSHLARNSKKLPRLHVLWLYFMLKTHN